MIINVDEGGLLAVTQQMSRFEFGRQPMQNPPNPFGSSLPKINNTESSQLNDLHSQHVNHYNNSSHNSDQVVLHVSKSFIVGLHFVYSFKEDYKKKHEAIFVSNYFNKLEKIVILYH